jgi:hypothetical protein
MTTTLDNTNDNNTNDNNTNDNNMNDNNMMMDDNSIDDNIIRMDDIACTLTKNNVISIHVFDNFKNIVNWYNRYKLFGSKYYKNDNLFDTASNLLDNRNIPMYLYEVSFFTKMYSYVYTDDKGITLIIFTKKRIINTNKLEKFMEVVIMTFKCNFNDKPTMINFFIKRLAFIREIKTFFE